MRSAFALAALTAWSLVGCSLLDPDKPDPNRPTGAESAEQAAYMFLRAAVGGNLDGLRHIVPDEAACRALDELPDCFEIQPKLETRLLTIQITTGPYANSALKASPNPSPITGSELWLAYAPAHQALVIMTFNVNNRYYALARVGI